MNKIYILITVLVLPILALGQNKPIKTASYTGIPIVKKTVTTADPLDTFKNLIYAEIVNFIHQNPSGPPAAQFSFSIKLDHEFHIDSVAVSQNAAIGIKTNLEKITSRLDFSSLIRLAKEMKWNDCKIIVPFIIFYETDERLSLIDLKNIGDTGIAESFSFYPGSYFTERSVVLKPKILAFGAMIR